MKCIVCGCTESKVIDSRATAETNSIRRRRQCLNCNRRWTTYETVEELPIMVVKKNGSLQPFGKSKMTNGIIKSCEKRPISLVDIENIASSIERDLKHKNIAEINSVELGDMVCEKLKNLDRVAYIRFASVYREFADADSFIEIINKK